MVRKRPAASPGRAEGRLRSTASGEVSGRVNPEAFEKLARLLRKERNFDLLSYKPRHLSRRLAARQRARSCADIDEYLALVGRDPEEREALIRALNISVSDFFRNPEMYDALRGMVLPGLIRRNKEAGAGLLAVSAGCARGEEPYSLAMVLRRDFKAELAGLSIRVIGLDVEGRSLAAARRGVYSAARIKNVPPSYRKLCLRKRDGGFEVADNIRGMVEFMALDVRDGLPFSGVDLILCRNVLIYFRREDQAGILEGFLRSLRPGGVLVLGGAESLMGGLRKGFRILDYKDHIYQKAGEEPCGWR